MTDGLSSGNQPLLEGYSFHETENPSAEDAIIERLVAFNLAHTSQAPSAPEERRPLSIFVHAADGHLIGGLVGRTHAIPFWFEVSVLWIDEVDRGRGLGRALMARAEGEARSRGCRYVRLATSHFQAPDFYAALGYTIYGALEDCPPGETVFYLRKNL
ncbi:MAG TPA: GNAT family N-acetyltransferase [Ktedonobacterales bacterium]|jgi:GNAT superfamily N-acetyltransferase